MKNIKWLLSLAIILLAVSPVIASPKATFKNVYLYPVGTGANMTAIHNRILETRIKDIGLGVQLYDYVDNTNGINVQPILDEVRWAKKNLKPNGTIWLVELNGTTRVGYDADGQYRYYRLWQYRIEALENLAGKIDYYIIDMAESHYSSNADLMTYLMSVQSLGQRYGFKVGVYDGDGASGKLDYTLMAKLGIFVWSDIYANGEGLASPAGWSYPYLAILCYLGPGNWQYNDQADFDRAYALMTEQGFTGYNLIMTDWTTGVLPDWWR